MVADTALRVRFCYTTRVKVCVQRMGACANDRDEPMRRSPTGFALRALAPLAALLLGACSVAPIAEQPDGSLIEPAIPETPLAEIPIAPAREPSTLIPLPVEAPPPIAIVLSSRQPAYTDVANELTKLHADAEVYELAGEAVSADSVMRSINDRGNGAVVAIGLRAARSAVSMANVPVVYCQVFNHHEFIAESERVRGVAAYGPLDSQLAAWREVNPGLKRIGMIIGEGHDDLIAEAEAASEKLGIELVIKTTNSDQETIYAFRRMSRDIDGFWLFPDNRVLSARALREISETSERNRVHLAVPNDAMLRLGAAISLSTVATDIATVVADVLEQIRAGALSELPRLSGLREISVTVSQSAVADAR